MASPYTDEKRVAAINSDHITSQQSPDVSLPETKEAVLEAREVFHDDNESNVKFRTVSWQRATIIFLKIQFAMSILAVPGALATLGAVGGALSIVGWEVLNTYTAVILGDFRNRHPECHSELLSSFSCILSFLTRTALQLWQTWSASCGAALAKNWSACKSSSRKFSSRLRESYPARPLSTLYPNMGPALSSSASSPLP
jgi:hypothetical protein